MTASGWLQLGIYVALLLAITKPLGVYLWRVLDPARAGRGTFLDPVLGPVERLIYRILRVDPAKEHNWKQYAIAMLMFSVVTAVFDLRHPAAAGLSAAGISTWTLPPAGRR